MRAANTIKDAAGAVAIMAVCTALYWPRPQATRPPTRDMGPPPALYVPAVVPAREPAPSCPAETTPAPLAESKACNPACVYPEKCIDGTCCRPASASGEEHGELIVNTRYDRR